MTQMIPTNNMDTIWDLIISIGKNEGGTILHRVAKLLEETGELSAGVLLKDGYKVNKYDKTDEEINKNILEEGVDSLIVLFDLLAKAGFTKGNIINAFNEKLEIWSKVIETNNEIIVEDAPPPNLIQNAMKCLNCGEIIISRSGHDYKTCSCGNLSVDGGLGYIRTNIINMEMVEDLTLTDNSFDDEIDNKLVWGVKTRDSVEYHLLCGLDTAHLNNILLTQKKIPDRYINCIRRILNKR